MNDPVRQVKRSPERVIALIVLGMFAASIALAFVWLVLLGRHPESFAQRVARAQTVESSQALEAAPDGTYLVYAMLRGDQVLYDDGGQAVVYLQEKRKGKDGTTHYQTIFSAKQFYLDGLAIEQPNLTDLYYPEFQNQYGSGTYKGLWHCMWGTFLVEKENGQYQKAAFFPHKRVENILERYGDPGLDMGALIGLPVFLLALLAAAIFGMVMIVRGGEKHCCPRCGKKLKKEQMCPECREFSVPQKKKADAVAAPKAKPQTSAVPEAKPHTPPSPEQIKKTKRGLLVGALAIASIVALLVMDIEREKRIASSGIDSAYAFRPIVSENVYREYPYTCMEGKGYQSFITTGGGRVEFELTSGTYLVGVHIPAGQYRVTPGDEFDALVVTDYDNQIYLYEYAAKQPNYLDDVRLLDGAQVVVETESHMTFRCDHALTDSLYSIKNPLTESVPLTGKASFVAGADFAPGVYDLYFGPGEISVVITVKDPYSTEDIVHEYSKTGEGEQTWLNEVLTENARIDISGGTLTLVPSPEIFSTYYPAYYELYP